MKTSKPKRSVGRPKKAATPEKTEKAAKSTPAKKSASSKRVTSGKVTAAAKAPAKTSRTRKAPVVKHEPTEEEIRARAREIYNERVGRGEFGSPEDDWFRAVESLKGKKQG
jgi:hypothetical protein